MTAHPDDTIVALSSAAGPGARAIVRLSGPNARAVVDRVFQASRDCQGAVSSRRLQSGFLHLSGVHSPLPATVYFFSAPNTYTGQDLAELHTISSPPLVERLIADLLAAGARSAGPGEFTLRAFLAGKKDLPQAEAVLAVIEANTDDQLTDALAQLAGGVSHPLHRLRDDLLNLLADVEAALDFVDEDIEFVSKPDTIHRLAAGLAHLTNLRRQLDDRTVSGRMFRVALVGEPNAGKSSLFNALVGRDAAIVSPTAGTTRDYLTARLDLGGVEVDLIDTAGLQPAQDAIDAKAQALGAGEANRADLVLWCVPALEEVIEAHRPRGADVLLVQTKADQLQEAGQTIRSAVQVSVHLAASLAELRSILTEKSLAFTRPPLAPSQSRCRHHVDAAMNRLRDAHRHAVFDDPPELLALALRQALDQIGEMTGAIHTNDLLDRIFSRFCIGK